jgi:acetyl esterase/lipase
MLGGVPATTDRYGPDPAQTADLLVPAGPGPHPVVVLVHGGFWRARYGRDLMTPLAADLEAAGWASWNVEYRRLGQAGGGWPGTFADVAAAVDHLAGLAGPHALDLARVVTVGHSAGGHLALWLACRPGLPAGAPGAGPVVRVAAAVAQAGVVDLVAGCDLSAGAAVDLLGGRPDEVPDRYALASPCARVPLGVPQLLVHGLDDDTVPVELSRRHAAAARAAGDDVELVELPAVGHMDVIDPAGPAWAAVRARLAALAPPA